MNTTVVGLFAVTYLGMALGRFPGLRIDRTGIAVVATILLLAFGASHAARSVGMPPGPPAAAEAARARGGLGSARREYPLIQ